MPILAIVISLALTACALLVLPRSKIALGAIDRPNHRSLHDAPTPRIGGVAMGFAVACTTFWFRPVGTLPLLALATVLMLLSTLDDRYGLNAAVRFAGHVAAAVLACAWLYSAMDLTPWVTNLNGVLIAVTAVIVIVWMTNLFNFMDGANGLAGGMAAIGFGTYVIGAGMAPTADGGILASGGALTGAAIGFLFFNFPRARVFMGDGGSVPLGFLAATLGIYGALRGLWEWWFGLLVFSPFIVDSTVTLFKRAWRRERVWQAHREHYYQRLILSGWSHRQTVVAYYFLMLGSALSALVAQSFELRYSIALFWVITYLSLLLYLERRFHQDKKAKTKQDTGAK